MRIRSAAIELFATKGFAATGIRELADRAGLSTASLYHYMGTKDDLLVELMMDVNRHLLDLAHEALARTDDPVEGLATLVYLHTFAHAIYRREAAVVDLEIRALSHDRRGGVVTVRDGYEQLWNDILDQGAKSGVFTFSDPALTRLAMIQMCTGVAHWYVPGRPGGEARVCASFVELALGMVHATRDGAPARATDVRLPKHSWFAALLHNAEQEDSWIRPRPR